MVSVFDTRKSPLLNFLGRNTRGLFLTKPELRCEDRKDRTRRCRDRPVRRGFLVSELSRGAPSLGPRDRTRRAGWRCDQSPPPSPVDLSSVQVDPCVSARRPLRSPPGHRRGDRLGAGGQGPGGGHRSIALSRPSILDSAGMAPALRCLATRLLSTSPAGSTSSTPGGAPSRPPARPLLTARRRRHGRPDGGAPVRAPPGVVDGLGADRRPPAAQHERTLGTAHSSDKGQVPRRREDQIPD